MLLVVWFIQQILKQLCNRQVDQFAMLVIWFLFSLIIGRVVCNFGFHVCLRKHVD